MWGLTRQWGHRHDKIVKLIGRGLEIFWINLLSYLDFYSPQTIDCPDTEFASTVVASCLNHSFVLQCRVFTVLLIVILLPIRYHDENERLAAGAFLPRRRQRRQPTANFF